MCSCNRCGVKDGSFICEACRKSSCKMCCSPLKNICNACFYIGALTSPTRFCCVVRGCLEYYDKGQYKYLLWMLPFEVPEINELKRQKGLEPPEEKSD